jgi:hypothetical protein
MKVIVRPGINAVRNGLVFRPGETAGLPQPVAYRWLGSGWAIEAAVPAGGAM